jgi:hypothetical protein
MLVVVVHADCPVAAAHDPIVCLQNSQASIQVHAYTELKGKNPQSAVEGRCAAALTAASPQYMPIGDSLLLIRCFNIQCTRQR